MAALAASKQKLMLQFIQERSTPSLLVLEDLVAVRVVTVLVAVILRLLVLILLPYPPQVALVEYLAIRTELAVVVEAGLAV